jgi:hypothetical protein
MRYDERRLVWTGLTDSDTDHHTLEKAGKGILTSYCVNSHCDHIVS